MPRKKLVRRFEPRYGVSREMIAVESKYVAREQEDWLLYSTADLTERLATLRQHWDQADQVLERAMDALSDRDKLAVQCLVVRDVYHLLELYCAHLSASDTSPAALPSATRVAAPQPSPPTSRKTDRSLPFSEWLFAPES